MWPSCVLRPIAAMASRLMQTHDPAAFCPLNSRRICAVDEWWLLLLLRLVLAFGSRKLAHIYTYIYMPTSMNGAQHLSSAASDSSGSHLCKGWCHGFCRMICGSELDPQLCHGPKDSILWSKSSLLSKLCVDHCFCILGTII